MNHSYYGLFPKESNEKIIKQTTSEDPEIWRIFAIDITISSY